MAYHQPETTTTLIHSLRARLSELERLILDNILDGDGLVDDALTVSAGLLTDMTTLNTSIQALNPESDNSTVSLS